MLQEPLIVEPAEASAFLRSGALGHAARALRPITLLHSSWLRVAVLLPRLIVLAAQASTLDNEGPGAATDRTGLAGRSAAPQRRLVAAQLAAVLGGGSEPIQAHFAFSA